MARDIEKVKTNFEEINPHERVTVFQTPRYTEIVQSRNLQENGSNVIPTRKLDRDHYLDIRTGEIKEYNRNYGKSFRDFAKSYKAVPRFIKGFFNGDDTERFITLTYKGYDTRIWYDDLSKDFKNFYEKLRRRYGRLRYFCIKEPNARDKWHMHVLVKRLDGQAFNITSEEASKLWGYGFVDIQKIKNINTLPAYFDISRYEKKLGRMRFYCSGMRFFSHSTDMKIEKIRTEYGKIDEYIKDKKLHYRQAYEISAVYPTGTKTLVGTNQYEQYIAAD